MENRVIKDNHCGAYFSFHSKKTVHKTLLQWLGIPTWGMAVSAPGSHRQSLPFAFLANPWHQLKE